MMPRNQRDKKSGSHRSSRNRSKAEADAPARRESCWNTFETEEANEQFTNALRECDLATIAKVADPGPQHDTPGDRLALLQPLFSQVHDCDMRDRLEDLAGIVAASPRLGDGQGRLLANVRDAMREELGPHAGKPFCPEALLIGFLKERSPWENMMHSLGAHADDLLGMLPSLAGRKTWHRPQLPSVNIFLAFCLKVIDKVCQPVTIRQVMIGQKSHFGGLADCTQCGGRGRTSCATCKGSCIAAADAVQRAMRDADYQQGRQLAEAATPEGISIIDLRRILGNAAIDCPACRGTGGDPCECAVQLDVPEDARVGWLCRFIRADDTFVQWARVKEIKKCT